MRAHQVFARMDAAQAERLLTALREHAPAAYTQSLAAAAAAMKARPQFLLKQPEAKRAQLVRRALSRVGAAPLAEEMLATYFLDVRKELLVEWLDAVSVPHDDGMLQTDRPEEPEGGALAKAVEAFLAADDDVDRRFLLEAFAAQSSIDWPALDTHLEPDTD